MKNLRFSFGICLAYCGALGWAGQKPQGTLADEIQAMHWEAQASGPLLALDVPHVKRKSDVGGLAAFERMKASVGALTAIAPTKMVNIDDSFRQQPNLYDGIPRHAKVLYLLTTLNSDQLKTATSRGIGLGDLYGEQKNVFQSLLPRPFKWQSYRVDANGMNDKDVDKGELKDSEVERVRLRFNKRLRFQLNLQDNPRSYTEHSTNEEYGQPGDTVYMRNDRDDYDRGDSFGMQIRQTVDNKPKASQLDYAATALNKTISLQPTENIDQLLRRIGGAAGLELFADLRVGDLPVSALGTQARAGDVLKAVAFMVTGTYRKVGSTYLLTSDLTGAGARKLRLAIRDNELQQAMWAKEDEWREAVGKAETPSRIPFDSTNPLIPNDAVRKILDKADTEYNNDRFSAELLTPNLRGFLKRTNQRYSAQPVDIEQIGVRSEVEYSFVLPTGQALHPEFQSLGDTWSFRPRALARPQNTPPVTAHAIPSDGDPVPLVVTVIDASEAKTAFEQARIHGFRELWLETRRPEALAAVMKDAKSAGISVRLMVRPWSVFDEGAQIDPERNILGETPAQALETLEASAEWKQYRRYMKGEPYAFRDLVAPIAVHSDRWAAFAALSATPGLAGTVILESQPGGYEPTRNRSIYGGYTRTLGDRLLFGYSVAQRVAFMRTKHLDPIDLADDQVHATADTRQPFFLYDALRGSSTVYDGTNEQHAGMENALTDWITFRAKLNASATDSLVSALAKSEKPNLIQIRRRIQNYPDSPFPILEAIFDGRALPMTTDDAPIARMPGEGGFTVIQLSNQWPLDPTDQTGLYLGAVVSRPPNVPKSMLQVSVDCSAIPVKRLGEMLDHFFTRAGDKN